MAAIGATVNTTAFGASTLGATKNYVNHSSTPLGQVLNTVAYVGATLATFADRISGVAPLAVICDAIDTASPLHESGVLQPTDLDYASFDYVWDFGEPSAGTWPTDGLSKNRDTGPLAAHVYETPGTYTIALTLTDASGNVYIYQEEITVSAFSGTTYYISDLTGNDLNDGLSEANPWKTFDKVFNNIATNRRFLFNRGDTFPTTGNKSISIDGPGIFGAYGTGAKPIISSSGTTGCLVVRAANWRIVDIKLQGPGATNTAGGLTFNVSVQTKQMLALRVDSTGFDQGIGWFHFDPIFATPHESNVLAECTALGNEKYGGFVGGRRLAIIGCNFGDNVGAGKEHALRIWQMVKGVLTHSNTQGAVATKHAIKLHGPANADVPPPTKYVYISDNTVSGGGDWTLTIGPQDNGVDERLEQIILERNKISAVSITRILLVIWARKVTVRNNIFITSGSTTSNRSTHVGQRGIEPASDDVRIYNNTSYKNDADSGTVIHEVQAVATNVKYRNNLASTPNNPGTVMISGTPAIDENNLLTNTPGFTNAEAGDFSLVAGSVALDIGSTLVEVRSDFTLSTRRPQGAAYDLGAYERV